MATLTSDRIMLSIALLFLVGSWIQPSNNNIFLFLFCVITVIYAVSNLIWLRQHDRDYQRSLTIDSFLASMGEDLSPETIYEIRHGMGLIKAGKAGKTRKPPSQSVIELISEVQSIAATNPGRTDPAQIDRLKQIGRQLILEAEEEETVRFAVLLPHQLSKSSVLTTAELDRIWHESRLPVK